MAIDFMSILPGVHPWCIRFPFKWSKPRYGAVSIKGGIRTEVEGGHFIGKLMTNKPWIFRVADSQTHSPCFDFRPPKLMVSETRQMDSDRNEPRKATAWATSFGCTTTAANWNCLTRQLG